MSGFWLDNSSKTAVTESKKSTPIGQCHQAHSALSSKKAGDSITTVTLGMLEDLY
jgi:hypothetical protein